MLWQKAWFERMIGLDTAGHGLFLLRDVWFRALAYYRKGWNRAMACMGSFFRARGEAG